MLGQKKDNNNNKMIFWTIYLKWDEAVTHRILTITMTMSTNTIPPTSHISQVATAASTEWIVNHRYNDYCNTMPNELHAEHDQSIDENGLYQCTNSRWKAYIYIQTPNRATFSLHRVRRIGRSNFTTHLQIEKKLKYRRERCMCFPYSMPMAKYCPILAIWWFRLRSLPS